MPILPVRSRDSLGFTWVALILVVGVLGGCASVHTRDATVKRAVRSSLDSFTPLSSSTRELLARHRISAIDPRRAAELLESASRSEPRADSDLALALAELWRREGSRQLHRDRLSAISAFRNAAAASAIAVGESRRGELETATKIHNQAVAGLIRLSQDPRVGSNARWSEILAGLGVNAVASSPLVEPSRFAQVEIAEDYRVRGMRHVYKGSGLGVAVVALRPNDRANPQEPSEAYYPPKFRVSATVVAMPGGSLHDGSWQTAPLTLTFHDPFQTRTVSVGQNVLPAAYDTTTPLAIQASTPTLSAATLAGLFVSEFQSGIEPGLYMLRQYQPGKIPVVFIHGLSSNPAAFVQTINDLRNDPRITERYQFLLFAYPTGRAIPRSAALLRKALYEMESRFGQDPAFHQMVLVGHSMGGNLTRYMVTDSGMELWNAVFNVPLDQFRASPETKKLLTDMLIFQHVPFVRRAIFIAAPHRGSRIADAPFGRTVSRFIQPPAEQTQLVAEVEAANGPNVFKDNVFRNRSINSIGNLSIRSPALLAIDRMPVDPGVRDNSIIFDFLGAFPTDLVVEKWSSTLPGVESETILPGIHLSEQSPQAVDEVRRLLLDEPLGQASPSPLLGTPNR